jgi:hypothetical protein
MRALNIAKNHREQKVSVIRANNDRLHAQIMATQRHLIDIGDTWVYTVEPVPAFSGPAVSEVYETKLDTTTHTDETGAESTPSPLVTVSTSALLPVKLKASIDSCAEHAPFKLFKRMRTEREAQYVDMETEFEKSTALRDARINMQRANIESLEGCICDSQRVHAIQLSELAAS